MPERTLVGRVEILEHTVEGLEALPGRVHAVELQIVPLREEMRAGFSALRAELQAEIRAGDEETRRYMRALHEEVIFRIATIGEARPRRPKR